MTDQPGEFEGAVTIVWPCILPSPAALPGHLVSVQRDGELLASVTAVTVHADADGFIWAELTMFAGPAGRPSWDGSVVLGSDGQPVTRTFPFLVAGMQTGTGDA